MECRVNYDSRFLRQNNLRIVIGKQISPCDSDGAKESDQKKILQYPVVVYSLQIGVSLCNEYLPFLDPSDDFCRLKRRLKTFEDF
jgi:hypothetical protein